VAGRRTLCEAEEARVQHGGAEEAQEKEAGHAAVRNGALRVAVTLQRARLDVAKHDAQLARAARRRAGNARPQMLRRGQQPRPALLRIDRRAALGRIDLVVLVEALNLAQWRAKRFLEVVFAETLHVVVERFGEQGVAAEEEIGIPNGLSPRFADWAHPLTRDGGAVGKRARG